MIFIYIKKIFLFFIFILSVINFFPIGKESISKKEIKIGEQINLTITIENLENVNVLWEDMNSTYNDIEIISKKHNIKGKNIAFVIIFTFFESGEYNNLSFTIPISQSNDEMLYLSTDEYDIKVNNPVSNEEIENIKNIKDPTSIKLKNEKEQANIPFYFSFFFKILLFITVLSIFTLIAYYYFYKYISRLQNNKNSIKIPPYHNFLAKLETIIFNENDDRISIEKKLSELTEVFKELIYGEFSLNAPSETTNELLISLKKINLNHDFIKEIKLLLNEIDMIKFAKAAVIYERLSFIIRTIREFGKMIHDYKLSLEPSPEFKENEEQKVSKITHN